MIELPYDPAISLMCIYIQKKKKKPENTHSNDTCTPVLIASLFIIAKTYKQPKCLTTDDRIKKIAHTHNRLLLSHKKEWNTVNL